MSIGATFQWRATAYAYVHVLTQSRLRWFEGLDDTPLAVQPETGAAGDDIRVELRSGPPEPEIQVKHGLGTGADFRDAVRVSASREETGRPLRFLVDHCSPLKLRRTIADGLARLRSGRTQPLPVELVELRNEFGNDHWIWSNLGIVPCDVEAPGDEGTKHAIGKLEWILVDSTQASTAWTLLCEDAGENATRRLRRDRDGLVSILRSHDIEVRPIGPNAGWHDSLEDSRLLIRRRYFSAALKHLDDLERELVGKNAESSVLYRLHAQRADALFHVFDAAGAVASARRALEHRPDGVEALRLLTLASIELGNLAEAFEYATVAVTAHPDNENAWMAMLDASAASGREPPLPPERVAASRPYRLLLCNVAVRNGRWARALEITDDLISGSDREPDLLLFRAQALHDTAEQGAPDAVGRRHDAIRLATELIEVVNDPANDFTRMALVVRALAHAALGEDDEADADAATALERYPSETDVLRVAVLRRAQRGDRDGVLDILRHPAVDREPPLLLMRAHALVANDPDQARRSLEAALGLVAADKRDTDFRVQAAMAAIDLKDSALARELLAGVSSEAVGGQLLVARGLLAVAERQFDEAEEHFRAAAALKPEHRVEMLTELAFQLAAAGARDRAVGILTELGDAVPDEARDRYVRLLFESGDLVRAQNLIEQALRGDPAPTWAFARAAQLALRRGDPEGARRNLAALDERGDLAIDGRIRLVLVLTQMGVTAEARRHLNLLRAESNLSGVQMMEVAELLVMNEATDDGIALAYRAARLLPNDPDVQRAFSGMAMLGGRNWNQPTEIGPDTYAVLRNDGGVTRTYVVLADGPIDAQRREISVDEARVRGLVGLKLGDTQIDHPGSGYLEEKWRVVRIAPAAVAVAHETAERFHERFANQRFYMRAFQSTEGTVTEFVPFIQSMEENRKHVTDLLTLYRTEVLPLGVMAKWLNVSIADLVESFGRDPVAGQLYVEWIDEPGQVASRTAATSERLVLTRSALATAQQLNLLDLLAEHYKLIAPTALLLELREELVSAARAVVEGRERMAPAPVVGFALRTTEPQDPALLARRDAVEELLSWAEAQVEFLPRPIEDVGIPGSDAEQVRERIGAPSFDALELVKGTGAPLYADDLGLRRFAAPDASCSTVSLLDTLSERRIIDKATCDALTLELVLSRYVTVRPSADVITLAIRRPTLPAGDLERACDLLSTPNLGLQNAAAMGAIVIQNSRAGLYQRLSTTDITRLLLRSMNKQFPLARAAVALRHAAEQKLLFLPADLEEVKRVCAEAMARAFDLRASLN